MLVKISKIIASELNGLISSKDKELFNKWLNESPENSEIYKEIKNEFWYNEQLKVADKYDVQEAWDKISPRIYVKSKIRRIYIQIAKYAALVLLLLSIGFFLRSYLSVDKVPAQIAQPVINPGINKAKLILDNGREILLSSDSSFVLEERDGTTIKKDSGFINYAGNDTYQKEIFNTIQTTRGEEFSLTLSDGTKVYLNAESKIKFPVNFIKDERIVEISGEAFFEVAHNAEQAFIVKTEKSFIKVLGTTFNVKAYADEVSELTTLVEGSVSIRHLYDERSEIKLKPGDQASVRSVNHRIRVRHVDPSYYTAWKDGRFMFRNEKLEDIVRDLQRWYDFEIEFTDDDLKQLRFGTSIGRYQEVNPIFKMMNKTNLVNIVQNKNKFTVNVIKE